MKSTVFVVVPCGVFAVSCGVFTVLCGAPAIPVPLIRGKFATYSEAREAQRTSRAFAFLFTFAGAWGFAGFPDFVG